ncbi:MAG: two-component system, sensor histidine kinase YesM [Clostridiales bacterium]|nr:two-component system, sensor histidine kinase YesM [Clostridiales bacterium]
MKKAIKFLRLDNIKVKNKLLLIYILCVLLPIVATDYAFFNYTRTQVEKQQLQQYKASLQRLSLVINKQFEDAIYVAYNMMTDRRFNDYLERQYRSLDEFYDVYNNYLRDMLQTNTYMISQVDSITVYTSNTTIPESAGYRHLPLNVQDEEWYRFVVEDPYGFSVVSYYESGRWYVSLIKDLNYYKKNNIKKILKIDFKKSEFVDILKTEGQVGAIYVVDGFNKVVYSNDDKYNSGFYMLKDINVANDDHVLEQNLDKTIGMGLWKIVNVVSDKNIAAAMNQPIKFIIMLAFLNIILASCVIYILSFSLEYRIDIVHSHIKKVRHQHFDIIECDGGKDEIGDLIRGFNRMASTIESLIKNVYEADLQKKSIEVEKKQAMINALQSQIDPHFLFNTLESMRMRSVVKGETETAQMIKYLSKIFRRILSWGSDDVTIKEELNYIKYFLEIQKYRFGDKLDYKIHVDEDVLNYIIPKMVIQPFVENACIHGIEGSSDNGLVVVEIKRSNSFVVFTIKDNGIGMSEYTLDNIYTSLEDAEDASGSVGIKNAYRRLKLLYGDDFRFRIDSRRDAGTVVTLMINIDQLDRVQDGEAEQDV